MTGVINQSAAGKIRADIQQFIRSEIPTVSKVEVAPGVYWFFDCPSDEDVYEPLIPVSVMFSTQANDFGEPASFSLEDYGDGFGDTLMAELEGVIRTAGVPLNELRLEYSPGNSDPQLGFYQFLGTIPNAIQT